MADYLLEIGCEEIPARMVVDAVRDLREALLARLRDAGLPPAGEAEVFGGPRRLAVLVPGLPERQPDRSERITGPPAERAYDADGKPTKAAIGFAQKLGIPVERLERAETAKGPVLAGTKETKGLLAAEVLARIVPEAVAALHFPKTMRWGSREVRFVRPVRSVVSLLGSDVVPLEVAGVAAGRESFGHRFLGSARVRLASASAYVEALRKEHVLVASPERKQAIDSALVALADRAGRPAGGETERDADLLDEVTELVEDPHVVLGRFDAAYLELPSEVLVTSMKHHQKSFPVRDAGGRLLATFANVTNVPDREGHIARGYERVLNARLADARFFWSEDRKQPLAARLPRLAKVVFHEKLGSYAAKVERLGALAPRVAAALGGDAASARAAGEAAALSKADLTTGMVGEFPELQGIVGGLYLEKEGADAAVARAVYEHYLPLSFEGPLPETLPGRALAVADKLDALVAFFGVGLVPSGTRDPFGLRRAAQGVVRVLLAGDHDTALAPLLAQAAELHASHPGASEARAGLPALEAYLVERIEHALAAAGRRPDTLQCVLAVSPLEVRSAGNRARAIDEARGDARLDATFTVLKRVAKIAGAGGETGYDGARFGPGEKALAGAFEAVAADVGKAMAARDHAAALAGIAGLEAPLHAFFAEVLVMDPDLEVRENRLRLLRAIGGLASPLGDFGKLQVER